MNFHLRSEIEDNQIEIAFSHSSSSPTNCPSEVIIDNPTPLPSYIPQTFFEQLLKMFPFGSPAPDRELAPEEVEEIKKEVKEFLGRFVPPFQEMAEMLRNATLYMQRSSYQTGQFYYSFFFMILLGYIIAGVYIWAKFFRSEPSTENRNRDPNEEVLTKLEKLFQEMDRLKEGTPVNRLNGGGGEQPNSVSREMCKCRKCRLNSIGNSPSNQNQRIGGTPRNQESNSNLRTSTASSTPVISQQRESEQGENGALLNLKNMRQIFSDANLHDSGPSGDNQHFENSAIDHAFFDDTMNDQQPF